MYTTHNKQNEEAFAVLNICFCASNIRGHFSSFFKPSPLHLYRRLQPTTTSTTIASCCDPHTATNCIALHTFFCALFLCITYNTTIIENIITKILHSHENTLMYLYVCTNINGVHMCNRAFLPSDQCYRNRMAVAREPPPRHIYSQ